MPGEKYRNLGEVFSRLSAQEQAFLASVLEYYRLPFFPYATNELDADWINRFNLLPQLLKVRSFQRDPDYFPQHVFENLVAMSRLRPASSAGVIEELRKKRTREVLSIEEFQRSDGPFSDKIDELQQAIDAHVEFQTERAKQRGENPDEVLERSYAEDMKTLVLKFLQPSNSVCTVINDPEDALLPIFVSQVTGQTGTQYVLTSTIQKEADFRSQFFQSILALTLKNPELRHAFIQQYSLGRETPETDALAVRRGEVQLVFRNMVQNFVLYHLKKLEQASVENRDNSASEGISPADEFFLFQNILPVQRSPIQGMAEMPLESVSAVILNGTFGDLPEGEKSLLCLAADRILRSGGVIMLRGDAIEQQQFMYYGQEFLEDDERYQFVSARLYHPQQWLIFKKANPYNIA